jgi:uncharacterized spore protein YtfJ
MKKGRESMEDLENLLKLSLGEIEKVLSSKSVVGEPMKIGDATLIPLNSVGFGFGGGGGTGKGELPSNTSGSGEGTGAGVGGGGGIKPTAIIIIDKDGVRVESIKGAASTIFDSLGNAIGQAAKAKQAEAET